ncbi:DUF6207 family protein [Streptomyces sp. NPDC056486]|uniref:DUF6207 family protein n=1 Tax=Streptomyces sp. NPDC056486 TaxID=3345835 RepID=UPI003676274D
MSITIHGADDATATTMAEALSRCHTIIGPSRPYRIPGEPGVRVHVYGHTDPADVDEEGAPTGSWALH